MSSAVAILTPDVLAELKRQTVQAEQCRSCGLDPVLVVRNGIPVVYVAHTSECPGPPPALRVVRGGETA